MKKPNRDIFCQTYPEFWLESRDARVQDKTHYQYQEITLASLRCFDGCELLECGCGSGDLLARLRHSHPNVRLYGLDLGRQSLEWAQRGPLAGQDVSLIEGDLVSLPIASDRFDRILCSSVMWYVPEPHVAIAELVRVLKPGGRFVFDVRPPYHVTNALARWSLAARRMIGETVLTYSFLSPRAVARLLKELPVTFETVGYFVLLPTRLPLLGIRWGNWVRYSRWLAFKAGHGALQWLANKLLITGYKL